MKAPAIDWNTLSGLFSCKQIWVDARSKSIGNSRQIHPVTVRRQLNPVCQSANPEGQQRYSPAQCLGTKRIAVIGDPDQDHISTSYVERQNLNMRMNTRRFTRLANAFSKKFANHVHMLAIFHMWYNFARVHQTLRVTPAMEAGLSSHVWSILETVDLCSSNMASVAA